MNAVDVAQDLKKVSHKKKAISTARYFRTGKGEYGEGDIFIGVNVPDARIIAKKYAGLPRNELVVLLKSSIHEHRSVALHILCLQYRDKAKQEKIFDLYMSHTRYINNWDLVDTSARDIVGHYIYEYMSGTKRHRFLRKYAASDLLWERRIAVIATAYGISKGKYEEICLLTKMLIKDNQDLIHKAVGWMLREMGKKNEEGGRQLRALLERLAPTLPRTTLRYSIERFAEKERRKYMHMK